ncbi:hypothetical protein GCM10025773_17760 [Microbacterium jejuense]
MTRTFSGGAAYAGGATATIPSATAQAASTETTLDLMMVLPPSFGARPTPGPAPGGTSTTRKEGPHPGVIRLERREVDAATPA